MGKTVLILVWNNKHKSFYCDFIIIYILIFSLKLDSVYFYMVNSSCTPIHFFRMVEILTCLNILNTPCTNTHTSKLNQC